MITDFKTSTLVTHLKGSRIITPGGILNGIVEIEDGKISGVHPNLRANNNARVIDVGDDVVMAGVIDPHVHINEPGRTQWEGFDTGTGAAIAGGITTIVDMPLNAYPVTTNAEAYAEKLASTQNKLHTNCGFWGGIVPGNSHCIDELVACGVLGFKAFLSPSGIDKFPNVTAADLELAMPVIARHNLPLLVHCEIVDDVDRTPADPTSYREYLATRPTEWELAAIELMIRLCETYRCKTHIVHLSAAGALAMIREAKEKQLPISVETAPHYLYFSAEEIPDGATAFKCAPPIRHRQNNEALWQGLQAGLIDFVATDHSPAPPDLKEISTGNFSKAWGGIASLQLLLPITWTAARQRGCTLISLAKWLSENAAELIGKQRSKGRIAVGYDADLVVWKPEAQFTVTAEMLLHRHSVTPYLRQQLFGVVQQTYIAGKMVYKAGTAPVLNCGSIITL